MTINELVNMLNEKTKGLDVSSVPAIAVSFDIKDADPSNFYVAINKNGKPIDIAPYAYNDCDCSISMNMDNLIKLLHGKLDAVAAFTLGKLKVNGNVGKALEFANLIKGLDLGK